VPHHLYTAHSLCLITSFGATRSCSSLFPSVVLLTRLVLRSLTHSVFMLVTSLSSFVMFVVPPSLPVLEEGLKWC